MNRAAFFTSLRRSENGVFGTLIARAQIEGCEGILDDTAGLPVSHVAYLLATAYHETAHTMQPVRETKARSDDQAIRWLETAWAKGQLKWVKKPYWRRDEDGKAWFGRGLVQITHKDNYLRAAALTGVDLVGDPNKALLPSVARRILIEGCQIGMFTGKKLSDYLPGDYIGARRIVNGTDRARQIAAYALTFESALVAGRYQRQPPFSGTLCEPAPKKQRLWPKWLRRILGVS